MDVQNLCYWDESHSNEIKLKKTIIKKEKGPKKPRKNAKNTALGDQIDQANHVIREMMSTKSKKAKFNFKSKKAKVFQEKYYRLFADYTIAKDFDSTISKTVSLLPKHLQVYGYDDLFDALSVVFRYLLVTDVEALFFVSTAHKLVQEAFQLDSVIHLCNGSFLFKKEQLTEKDDSFKRVLLSLTLIALMIKERTASSEEKMAFLVAVSHLLHVQFAVYVQDFLAEYGYLTRFNLIELNDIHKTFNSPPHPELIYDHMLQDENFEAEPIVNELEDNLLELPVGAPVQAPAEEVEEMEVFYGDDDDLDGVFLGLGEYYQYPGH